MTQEILVDDFRFNGVMNPPAVASVLAGPFASKITKTAGTPTVSAANTGGMALVLDATSEVQNACFYMGDILPYPLAKIVSVEFWASLTASLNAAITASFGLANARNDALASITQRLLFRFAGNNNLLIDAVDGTNSVTAFAPAGQTLSAPTTPRRFMFELMDGVTTLAGQLSTGGSSKIRASAEGNAQGTLRWLNPNQVLNISAAGNLQLFAQIQKTAAAAGATLNIQRIRVKYRPY